MKDIDVSNFWCWNKECPDYGKRGKGNIVLRNGTGKTVYGLRCKTSGHCFSENHGNHVFPIKKTPPGVLRTLSLFPEKERYPRVLVEQLDMIRIRS